MRLAAACCVFASAFAIAAQPQEPARKEPARKAPLSIANEVRGLKLFMPEYTPTREARPPAFSVEAELGARQEDGVWTLENVTAIAHNDEGEPMTIKADQCYYDEPNQIARLSGNVIVTAGASTLALQEVEWNNKTEEATTKGIVDVRHGKSQFTTEGIVIKPREETILCRNARGRIRFGEDVVGEDAMGEEPAQ